MLTCIPVLIMVLLVVVVAIMTVSAGPQGTRPIGSAVDAKARTTVAKGRLKL